MEKIFDPEVEKYLRDTGVSDKVIARLKFKSLKTKALERLDSVRDLLNNEVLGVDLDRYISHSPAGDDMGLDNDFIDFGPIIGKDSVDIRQLFDYLCELKIQVSTDKDKYKIIEAFGLKTRTWTFKEQYGYGCAECCTGDRCDEDCDAKYKGRRKDCPHCKGNGWIKVEDVTST